MRKKFDIYEILYIITLTLIICVLLVALHFARRVYIADQFVIPTESMLPTMIPGDRVIVNKLIFGARIYDEFDFGDGVAMKSHRTRGWRKIKHNDILIFNFPINRNTYKIEFKLNYVYGKRCIGLPGDTVSIINGYFINSNFNGILGNIESQHALSQTPDSLIPFNVIYAMPFDPVNYGWTVKNFGPLYIPKAGGKIHINAKNIALYRLPIEFETGQAFDIDSVGNLTLGKQSITEYTFTKSFYFMCGDNVLDSNDSRYWGFVPEEFIVGVVSHVTYSQDKITEKFVLNRFCKRIK